MKNVTAVIDVRTPQEYVEGHLDGAVNIDVEASDFVSIIKTLNGNGTYVVYCRSGKRAEVAKQKMAEFGITNVTNAGSMEDASKATGLKILQ
jgi:rhodanese-related sulfurtransferase